MSVLSLRDAFVPPALQNCVAVGAIGIPRFWTEFRDLSELKALAREIKANDPPLTMVEGFLAPCCECATTASPQGV